MNKYEKLAIESAATKVLLGLVPGGNVLQEFFELRGNTKRLRIETFISTFLLQSGFNIEDRNPVLNEEDFNDLLEAVFLRE
jgi:ribosome biogenesis GTPase A